MGDLKIAMAEENNSQVEEKCCLDNEKPMNEEIQGDDVVLLPPVEVSSEVNVRRYSTGGLDKRGGSSKAQVQTRYRGNQMSSTHDLCKHGKRREDDLVIKPWKLVKKKNVVESGELVKDETLTRKSLGNVSKPERSLQVARKSCDGLRVKGSEAESTTTPPSDSAVVRNVKKTSLDVKKVPRISEKKSTKEELFKNPKNKEKTKIDEVGVLEKKVSRISENKSTKEDLVKIKGKTKIDEPVSSDDVLEKKFSRTREDKSSKEVLFKSPRNKETITIDEPVVCEDVLEKTLYVVEASIEKEKKKSITSVKSEIQQSPEKKILRGSGKKSLKILPSSEKVKGSRVTRSDPTPIRQTTSRSKIGLPEKKEIGSATPKAEVKIRPTRIGLKVTPPPSRNPTRQLDFKKGKVLEPKPEASSSTLLKFKKRVVQEPRTDVNKKKKILKGVVKTSITIGEGKREKVVLRHRKVEAKKKLQTLFNNVIEETVNKLEEVKKSSKVKALVGAFETVISLQDETSHKKKTQPHQHNSLKASS